MDSSFQNNPEFLSRAKLISEKKQPDFLAKAKLISKPIPEEQYLTDEEVQRDIERSQAMHTSRAIEAVAGLPGDLVNLAGSLFGFDVGAPGSQKMQEISESLTHGYTSPKSEEDVKSGEFIQDVALFALPGAKHYSFARNLGIPIIGNLAKEGIEFFGGDEKQKTIGKVGTMVLLDILSQRKGLGTAKEYASSLFKQADEAIPKGLSINASTLDKSLSNLENVLKAGGERPSTGDALKKISEIKNEIKNGKIDLKKLVAYRPAINELIDNYKGFDIQVKPAIKEKIINNLNKVKSEVIKSAQEYGSKYNPEFLNLSKSANEAWAAYSQSNKITNFLQKHLSTKLSSNAAKALLLGGYTGGIGALGALGGATAGAIGGATVGSGYKIFKTILRSKSPTLRNHYFKIIEGAAKGNIPQVIKNAKSLDKELKDIDITGEIEFENEIINNNPK